MSQRLLIQRHNYHEIAVLNMRGGDAQSNAEYSVVSYKKPPFAFTINAERGLFVTGF